MQYAQSDYWEWLRDSHVGWDRNSKTDGFGLCRQFEAILFYLENMD